MSLSSWHLSRQAAKAQRYQAENTGRGTGLPRVSGQEIGDASTRTCRFPGGRAHTGTVVPVAHAGVVVWYNHDRFSVK